VPSTKRGALTVATITSLVTLVAGATSTVDGATSRPTPSPTSYVRGDLLGTPSFFFPATGFGGYSVTGTVHAISASWRVPKILRGSKFGIAATWIGVQNASRDFIQIGVNELSYSAGRAGYELFWSDTAKNFHPQSLGSVSGGQLLNVSMTQDKSGWRLRLRSGTKKLYELISKQIDYDPGAAFTRSEWIQENPAPSMIAARDSPYPKIANATFQDVKVNGRVPHLTLSDGQVLIASNGAIRVPTSFQNDSFSFYAPTGPAKQYLGDARRLDAGASEFDAAEVTWSSTSVPARRHDVNDFIDDLELNVTLFGSQNWPSAARAPIKELDALTKQQITLFETWSRTSMRMSSPIYLKYLAKLPEHDLLVDQIRGSLGLPPLF
jgi:Peptidase A4 family